MQKDRKYFSEAEAKRLLKACQDKADLDIFHGRSIWVTRHMLVSLALRSGMRIGEIAALRIKHIHLSDNYLAIKDGSKNGKHRPIYIKTELAKHIKAYLTWKKKAVGQPIEPEDYLLTKLDNTRYTTTALHLSFKQALKEAGLSTDHSLHSCRHTFATYTFHSTLNLLFTQKQLGHSSTQTTAIYAHLLPEKNNELAEAINI